jgi:hypothetical protein
LPSATLQVLPASHWASFEHSSQRLRESTQPGLSPEQSASLRHSTQVWLLTKHSGRPPAQSALVVQCETHAASTQVSPAVQSAVVRQSTQTAFFRSQKPRVQSASARQPTHWPLTALHSARSLLVQSAFVAHSTQNPRAAQIGSPPAQSALVVQWAVH